MLTLNLRRLAPSFTTLITLSPQPYQFHLMQIRSRQIIWDMGGYLQCSNCLSRKFMGCLLARLTSVHGGVDGVGPNVRRLATQQAAFV